jgi:hypothetical protein
MIYLGDIIRQLTVNAQAIQAVVESISDEQAGWQPDANTWAMQTVIEHLYNEERGDFRAHLQEIFNDPPQPWGALQPPWTSVADFRQALAGFLAEREASIAWLRTLPAPNWDATISASFGPQNELLELSAGDLLVSWVAHDHLHLRQVNELLFAWNAHQAQPYKVDYAGGW